jgi:hypothetical protein
MSDRTSGSVRSGSPAGDAAAPKESPPGTGVPISATQAIPGTGTQRAQAPQAPTGSGLPAGRGGPPAAGGASGTPAAGVVSGTPAAGVVSGTPAAGVVSGTPAAGVVSGTPAAGAASGTSAAGAVPGISAGGAAGVAGVSAAGRPAARTAQRPTKSGRGPRRARLQLRHVDTWSALKISLILSIALFFIWMVAVGILYMVLSALGVFETLNDLFGQVGSVNGSEATQDVITPGVVFGGAAVIGAINIVLMTALCTVGTFIYNLCSDLVGGLEITLSERD